MTKNEILAAYTNAGMNYLSLEEAAAQNYKGQCKNALYNVDDPEDFLIPLELEKLFDNNDVIVYIDWKSHLAGDDMVEVVLYRDKLTGETCEEVMYYPLDRFANDFADLTPEECWAKLDVTDESLW